MKNAEIAKAISAFLKQMEADPVFNAPYTGTREGQTPFYHAGCSSSGRYIHVQYVGYQGNTHLSKEEALTYLSWLQAGNRGTHYQALKDAK